MITVESLHIGKFYKFWRICIRTDSLFNKESVPWNISYKSFKTYNIPQLMWIYLWLCRIPTVITETLILEEYYNYISHSSLPKQISCVRFQLQNSHVKSCMLTLTLKSHAKRFVCARSKSVSFHSPQLERKASIKRELIVMYQPNETRCIYVAI